MLSKFFKLRGELSSRESLVLEILGVIVFVGMWSLVAHWNSKYQPSTEALNRIANNNIDDTFMQDSVDLEVIHIDTLTGDTTKMIVRTPAKKEVVEEKPITEPEYKEGDMVRTYPILPPPGKVLKAIPELQQKQSLAKNTIQSVMLNFQGYFFAILVAIPIGFIIGLFPIFKGMFSRQVNAIRFIPLTAVTGLFIIWFGIDQSMKVSFLAFGILVYLLPVIVQRIEEVNTVYTKTVYTLGATKWQTITTVFFPAVMAKISDDIRVLTAISWTYIIVAEMVNNTGGVGSMIWKAARQSRIDQVFAVLLIIILIGFLQDKLFLLLDRVFFPHKYANKH